MNIITTKFKVFHYDLVLILFIEIIVFFNDSLQNESLCLDYVHTLPNNETVPVCGWDHDGSTGILYQVLAGPVFNNLYPLAGIIMGILADKFNRKILLGLSLLFWSVATGLTGFSQYYWMLVVFRMLLAIGLVSPLRDNNYNHSILVLLVVHHSLSASLLITSHRYMNEPSLFEMYKFHEIVVLSNNINSI
jgi:MFS family permease